MDQYHCIEEAITGYSEDGQYATVTRYYELCRQKDCGLPHLGFTFPAYRSTIKDLKNETPEVQ